jgi:hypothetical protein
MAGARRMSDLDLSFASFGKEDVARNAKPAVSGDLDLSFLDEKPQTAGLKPISPVQQEPERQTAPESEGGGLLSSAASLVTGEGQKGESSKELGEFDLPTSLAFTKPVAMARTAAGLMMTFDPRKQVAIIARNFPELKFEEDEKGNIVVDASAYGGEKGFLNMPGISFRDVMQFAGQAAAYTPAARTARAGAAALSNAARVGSASAATAGATSALSDQAAKERGTVKLGDVREMLNNPPDRGSFKEEYEAQLQGLERLDPEIENKGEMALTGVIGAGSQAVVQTAARALPWLYSKIKATKGQVTDDIRQAVRRTVASIGGNADDVTDDMILDIAMATREGASPAEAVAVAGEREFDVPLKAGQRTLDDAQLSFEEASRTGTRGEAAQRISRSFEEKQQQKIGAAQGRISQQVIGGGSVEGGRGTRGAIIGEQVRTAEEAASEAVSKAYDAVGDASLKPGAFQDLIKATRQAIDDVEFVNRPKLTKATNEVLNDLDKAARTIGRKAVTPSEQPRIQIAQNISDLSKAPTAPAEQESGKLTATHINQIEAVRKSIRALKDTAENMTDRRNITEIQRRFDNFMDDAVANALFEGDEAALQAIKHARGVFREYANKFRSQKTVTKGGKRLPDPQGDFIEKLVAGDPTGEQVVNAVFGAGNFSNTAGAKMASRFKQILGADSEGWRAIKEEAVSRLFKTNTINGQPVLSGQKTLTAINDAMEKNGSLMHEIFSKQEIGLMRRFAAHVKRTQPDLVRSRENPSGTAQTYIKAIKKLPFADAASELIGGLGTSGQRARAATRTFEETRQLVKPGTVAAGTAGGQKALE